MDILLSLCMFWSGLHACKYLAARLHFSHSSRELTRSRAVLPIDRMEPSRTLSLLHYVSHKVGRVLLELQLHLTLTLANLRVETTVFNVAFDKASTQITRAPPRSHAFQVKSILGGFYSLGAVAGLLGMALGYVLLVWSCLEVLYNMITSPGFLQNGGGSSHVESEALSSTDSAVMGGTGLAVQPIVSNAQIMNAKIWQTCSDTRCNSATFASTNSSLGTPSQPSCS